MLVSRQSSGGDQLMAEVHCDEVFLDLVKEYQPHISSALFKTPPFKLGDHVGYTCFSTVVIHGVPSSSSLDILEIHKNISM